MIELSKDIDYEAIAQAYGYKPIPGGYTPIAVDPLTIDWKSGSDARNKELARAMRGFDSATLTPSLINARRKEASLAQCEVPTDYDPLRVSASRWDYPDKNLQFLRLGLTRNDEEVAQYLSKKEGKRWELSDRITSEAYRKKGVASQMIEMTEQCIQAYADAEEEDQVLELEASQLPVLSVFLKKGYKLDPKDEARYSEVMSALESGDPKYILASCESDFENGESERKTWYVFEREVYEKMGEKIWEYDEVSQKANYMKHSVRFRLRKEIPATRKGLEDISVETRTAVGTTLNN